MESEREIKEVDDSISMESALVLNDPIVEELANSIKPKLLKVSPVPASCCIFKVPGKIRRKKERAYEPDIVSIGPFHSGRHGDSGDKFRLMEKVKHWYLHCLLSRVDKTLEDLIKGVMDLEEPARGCYAEPFDLNKKDFVEMMVLDGCFLLELFRKGPHHDDINDPVYSVSCTMEYLYHDLILLENQLPWFVLERLYNLTAVKNTTCEGNASSLTGLVLDFFRQNEADVRLLSRGANLPKRILHIVDLIRKVIVFQSKDSGFHQKRKRRVFVFPFKDLGSHQKEEDEEPQQKEDEESQQRVPNVTTLSNPGIVFQSKDSGYHGKRKRRVFVFPFKHLGSHQKEEDEEPRQREDDEPRQREDEESQQRVPNVTTLSNAGIKLESSTTELPQRVPNVTTLSNAGIKLESSKPDGCIMNIRFEKGVLTIPPLAIDETTGPLFRNLIAFEQCYHGCSHMITSYAVLMDNLIDSSKDIDLLCERGILANWLSSEDAAQFFNKLYNDTTVIDFHYEELCSKVIKHYNSDWNKSMEKLRREHFGTPWAIISLVAAFILLALTMLQTVYTIQQYYHPSS